MSGTPYNDLDSLLEIAVYFHVVEPGQSVSVREWFNGRYQIENYLGGGSTAIAFLALDTLLDRKVALKVGHSYYKVPREMFLNEARTLSKLRHPRIVQIYDFGEGGKGATPWAALEYLGGTTLQSVIQNDKGYLPPVPFSATLPVATQIASLLEYLHDSAHVYQLDLKPANIAYDATTKSIKMMDFGSVLPVDGRREYRYGTPGYLAPELIGNKYLDPACDVFSFGVLLIEMLTGVNPFVDAQAALSVDPLDWYSMPKSVAILTEDLEGGDSKAMEQAHKITQLMRKVNTDTLLASAAAPSAVKEIVRSMLSFAPEQRPRAHAVLAALTDVRSEDPLLKKARVFISHSHADKERFVNGLCEALEARGFDVWIDARRLVAGQPFWEIISKEMAESQFVIVVLSSTSVTSQGVAEELRLGQILDLEGGAKLIPIRIDPVDFKKIPAALRSRHILDFVGWESENVFDERVGKLSADLRLLQAVVQPA